MAFRTDRQRVEGLGSAKEGVGHWWTHRLTSVALVPLTLLFIFPFARALGGGYAEVRAVYEHPWNALVAALFIGVALHHHMQGLQVVIEDYIHGKTARTAALIANTLICWALGLAGVFAVLKIAFGA